MPDFYNRNFHTSSSVLFNSSPISTLLFKDLWDAAGHKEKTQMIYAIIKAARVNPGKTVTVKRLDHWTYHLTGIVR